MAWKPRLASFIRNLLFKDRVERELDEELRSYVEMAADENRRAGLADEAARRGALVELGGFDQVKERVRDARAGALVDQLRQDLSYAVRMLRKNPGFTAVAVTTLALGIGANTAIFSIADTAIFRPFPYENPDGLVLICGTGPRDAACDDDFSLQELESISARGAVFDQVAADDGTGAVLARPDGSREPLGIGLVTTNWLSTLGVRPVIGRDFTRDEGQPGRNGVVILTHDYWRRQFHSGEHVLGATLAIDGNPHTVIGILPPNVLRLYADVLKPIVLREYTEGSLGIIGRMKPGMTLTQAAAGVKVIGERLEHEFAANKERQLGVQPLGKYYASVGNKARQGLMLMLGAVGLVVLIACANVANLLLARAGARRRECVIRSALGASRARLVRQFLLESVLLFVLGGALGVLFARSSIDSLTAFAISGGYLPERMTVVVDLRVLGVALLLSIVTGLAFGLIPALQASRVDMNSGLRDATRSFSSDLRRGRTRRLLIVSELALSLVLLAGFGLLIRSFERVYAASGGFDPDNVIVTSSDGGRSFAEAMAFWHAVLDRARAIPGVMSAAVTSRPPVHFARRKRFIVEGRPAVLPEDAPLAGDILVSADYFETLRIPLIRGRAFTPEDNATGRPVAVISQSLASRYFGDENPVGRHLSALESSPMTCCTAPGPVEGVWREIIGVVGDVRQVNLDEDPAATVYRPYEQIVEHDMYLVLRARSDRDAGRIATELRSQMSGVDSNKAWWDVLPMWQVIRGSESIRLRRFVLILLGSFAAIALVLAAVGIYGVASSAVVERTKEIGVRIALGATRRVVFRQMLGEMMVLAAGGVVLGSAGALALTRLIRTMLFGVSATDAATYVGVAILLGGVVLLATYVPARRAMQIDPIVALRHE
jgi:predicted permease